MVAGPSREAATRKAEYIQHQSNDNVLNTSKMSRTHVAGSKSSGAEKSMGEDALLQGKAGSKIVVKTRKSIHFLRKLFHALAGILMAGSYEWIFTTQKEAVFFYACFFAFVASGEMMRLYFLDTAVAKFVFRFMSILARNYELKQASGMVFFVAGVLSVIVLFPKRIAILSILFLSFGDPFASACGIRLGYLGPKFRNGAFCRQILLRMRCTQPSDFIFHAHILYCHVARLVIRGDTRSYATQRWTRHIDSMQAAFLASARKCPVLSY